jgi:hypothetical protein
MIQEYYTIQTCENILYHKIPEVASINPQVWVRKNILHFFSKHCLFSGKEPQKGKTFPSLTDISKNEF